MGIGILDSHSSAMLGIARLIRSRNTTLLKALGPGKRLK